MSKIVADFNQRAERTAITEGSVRQFIETLTRRQRRGPTVVSPAAISIMAPRLRPPRGSSELAGQHRHRLANEHRK